MAAKSEIQWTGSTWTPVRARNLATGKVGWHCEHATTGCIHCYSERQNIWTGTGLPFKPGHRKDVELFLDEKMLLAPLTWKKPRPIFVCSMTDAFADFVPDEWLDNMFAIMALCQHHTFQVLTKRAERMRAYITSRSQPGPQGDEAPAVDIRIRMTAHHAPPGKWAQRITWPLPNVWLGVSAERQEEASDRIPQLLQTPAALRFVSLEPLIGPIDLHPSWLPCPACKGRGYYLPNFAANHFVPCERCLTLARECGVTILPGQQATPGPRLGWIIVGGESGDEPRPMSIRWVDDIAQDCRAAGVPCFVKQLGAKPYVGYETGYRQFLKYDHPKGGNPEEWPAHLRIREMPPLVSAVAPAAQPALL